MVKFKTDLGTHPINVENIGIVEDSKNQEL
jgi:hypothetical protein